MQLFISQFYNRQDNSITISDERITHQCFHVLRYKPNQILQLQHNDIRYTLCITQISKKEIITDIHTTETYTWWSTKHIILSIALPNRFDKIEFIIQKLTEIGIDHINFRKADRSILRDIPEKKLQRLQSIALEAAEQSFRRQLPTIAYLDNNIENHITVEEKTILFNRWGIQPVWWQQQTIHALIGPEWWFSPTELESFKQKNVITYSLWETILRMETAAIIWSRLIKNL